MGSVITRVTWTEADTGKIVYSELTWSTTDPLAMKINFLQEEDIEWIFGFELLSDVIDGKRSATGYGDVKFLRAWGGPYMASSSLIYLGLSSPFGSVTMHADLAEVETFVVAVHACQPELFTTDIDAALTKLLEGNYE